MVYSPWGEIQHSHDITRGIKVVSTAGHGGIMISEALAKSKLPPIALKKAIFYSGYYCFEEDCAYAIPSLIMNIPLEYATREQLEKVVKDWYPEIYEAFTKIKLNVEDSYVLRKRKHIEDIKNKMVGVSAMSTKNDNVIVTACRGGRNENGQYNDKTHEYLVSSQDYQGRMLNEFGNFIFEDGDYPCLDSQCLIA